MRQYLGSGNFETQYLGCVKTVTQYLGVSIPDRIPDMDPPGEVAVFLADEVYLHSDREFLRHCCAFMKFFRMTADGSLRSRCEDDAHFSLFPFSH